VTQSIFRIFEFRTSCGCVVAESRLTVAFDEAVDGSADASLKIDVSVVMCDVIVCERMCARARVCV
jgi:hypothetical protein